ncbi:hypothetical protein K466DRAFT_606602 [Polyporus arcularius HHB13444]|uniref:Uncharacterized protein n=1 Tax=Polyporus arcularius HHB13444 TaxID=1314778 RepID=A0A5C3NSA8_9APHY|nr:hypothetical protein K466DRAFT_606602 [Polyporus arcularius HHB13444]
MDTIALHRKAYDVFESLLNETGQRHMKITYAEYIKAMERAGFTWRWDKKGRFDPPASLDGGSLHTFNVTHTDLGKHISPTAQNEIRRALKDKYGLSLASFVVAVEDGAERD